MRPPRLPFGTLYFHSVHVCMRESVLNQRCCHRYLVSRRSPDTRGNGCKDSALFLFSNGMSLHD